MPIASSNEDACSSEPKICTPEYGAWSSEVDTCRSEDSVHNQRVAYMYRLPSTSKMLTVMLTIFNCCFRITLSEFLLMVKKLPPSRFLNVKGTVARDFLTSFFSWTLHVCGAQILSFKSSWFFVAHSQSYRICLRFVAVACSLQRLKRQWDFLSKVISPKVPTWPPDSWSKAVLNVDSNSPRYSTFKVLLCYGPMQQIWFCIVGPCSEFGAVLWATAAYFFMCYGPLLQIWLCAVGHYGRFAYANIAAVWNETIQ
jgi:hypothetical protein